MNKKAFARIAVSSAVFTPVLAFAADDIAGIFSTMTTILNSSVIPFLFLVATVIFLYGVITYLTAGGDEEKASNGKKYIIWGVIALFAMIAIWGIVWAVSNTFSLPGSGIPTEPL
ncbi:MAG: hypothetical protein Q8P07_05835 [bacterium]|nr:hypothetical protein [bacterium]